jgi:hypothetical protein
VTARYGAAVTTKLRIYLIVLSAVVFTMIIGFAYTMNIVISGDF